MGTSRYLPVYKSSLIENCEEYHHMSNNKIITINGRKYDSVTGLPINAPAEPAKKPSAPTVKPAAVKPKPAPTRTSVKATSVHATTERSKTLRRTATKKPATTTNKAIAHPTRGRSMDIARSTRVAKFAPHPEMKSLTTLKYVKKPTATKASLPKSVPQKAAAASRPISQSTDKKPKTHPMAQRAMERKKTAKPTAATSPKSTVKNAKDEAINKALQTPTKKPRKKRKMATWKKRFIIGMTCLAILIGGGLAIYRLVPSVSVSIAAAQAGVRASYPEYTPDGFSLHHPVTYSEGEVLLTFNSNSNNDSYTISQTKSSWDSTAVLDNIVRAAVGENYVTTQERGLTIYTYDSNASWVNGGVLYTISSDAQLSYEQIRRIATSL